MPKSSSVNKITIAYEMVGGNIEEQHYFPQADNQLDLEGDPRLDEALIAAEYEEEFPSQETLDRIDRGRCVGAIMGAVWGFLPLYFLQNHSDPETSAAQQAGLAFFQTLLCVGIPSVLGAYLGGEIAKPAKNPLLKQFEDFNPSLKSKISTALSEATSSVTEACSAGTAFLKKQVGQVRLFKSQREWEAGDLELALMAQEKEAAQLQGSDLDEDNAAGRLLGM